MIGKSARSGGQQGKVLVLGKLGNTRACLAVVRSLGRRGLAVHLAVREPDRGPVAACRYLKQVHCLPAYEAGPRQWLARLLELVRREDFEAVFPVTDAGIIPLQEHRRELGELEGRFALLNDLAYRVSYNKGRTRELAVDQGIPVAEGGVFECADAASRFAEKHGFPVVIKPISSFTEDNLSSKQFVQTLYCADDINALFARRPASYIVERYFHGLGCGVEFLANKGDILFAFQHERVHQPLHGGGSSYRKSVELHGGLLAASRKLVQALDYTGVGMIEYKLNPSADAFIFVEINGRFWGSLPLAMATGADFPAWLYAMLWHGATDFAPGYRVPHYGRNILLDAEWLVRNLRADKSDPTLMTEPLGSVVAELRHVFLGRESWDTWAWDDPLPFFSEFGWFLRKLPSALVQHHHP